MLPISFDPALPALCLALALGAPLIALTVRRRRPDLARPTHRQIAATLLSGVAGLVVLLVSGLVLEMCAAEALMRSSHGAGVADPMSWLGAATALLSGGSRVAWQATLLFGPLLFALDALGDWRPPARPLVAALALMLSPIFAMLVIAVIPLDRPPSVLLAALMLWVGVVGLAMSARRRRPRQPAPTLPIPALPPPRPTIAMQVIRQPTPITGEEADLLTEISLLPAALARQIDAPMPAQVIPIRAPLQLPPAAVRRARRLQKTLAEVPRRTARG